MLDPRTNHAQLAEMVADVQAILWQESRMLPDDPRQYGEYWNPRASAHQTWFSIRTSTRKSGL